jgi:quercetin dioxygenase-like cupin family protein
VSEITSSNDTRYVASPRPTFDEATAIRFADVTRHVWGDEHSGEVMDWIYVSSAKIHQIVFGLAPGKSFGHSNEFRTIFAADEVLYVLSGELLIANPQTAEVHRAAVGDAVFFRRDTWHHAIAHGSSELRVLELFAPPPSAGTSGSYARTRDNLLGVSYADDDALQRWPMERSAIREEQTMEVLRGADQLWRLEGEDDPVLVGILASTEHLTAGTMELRPGQRTAIQRHGGDESGYVLEGTVGIRIGADEGRSWLEVGPGDGFYVPEGVPHRYYNAGSTPARLIFGVAPSYLP